MGNFCKTTNRAIIIENESSLKLCAEDNERKVVLRFLLEKTHLMKTEESKIKINDQLREAFIAITQIDINPESYIAMDNAYDKDHFDKAIAHYENLFKTLKLESFDIFKVNNYFELSKTLVINYYGFILLRDKSFVER